MSSYYRYKFCTIGTGELIAEYIAETSPEAVEKDLSHKSSLLRSYAKRFCSAEEQDARKWSKQNPDAAVARLGGLVAQRDCARRFQIGLSEEVPPAAECALPKWDLLASAATTNTGVRLWLGETGDVLLHQSQVA